MNPNPYTIYFAGELFDHKHLIGNKLLATHIEKVCHGEFRCFLPQEFEQTTNRSIDIRDQDLFLLLTSDLAIFNFDGQDLDSGTVVEFMLAKMLDIPSVIIRTDMRLAGDQRDGDPWNLMCSQYPRTEVILKNGIEWYQRFQKLHDSAQGMIDAMYHELANEVVEGLVATKAQPSLFEGDLDKAYKLYQWAVHFPGQSFVQKCAGLDLKALLAAKHKKSLFL